MYNSNGYNNSLSNSVFMYIRNTPYSKLNTNSFRSKLHSIVVDFINNVPQEAVSEEDSTDSLDKLNNCLLNSENYSIHFVLPKSIHTDKESCSLYGFEGFEGVFALRNFLTPDQCLLLSCETLRSYINPPNNSNLLVTNPNVSSPLWPGERFKGLRWSTIGHLYDWGKRQYVGFTQFPEIIVKIICEINTLLSEFYDSFKPDSAIINFYSKGYFLRLHRDDAEETDDPVINISLGAPAIFSICKEDPSDLPLSFVVDSGSIVIMSQNSRRCLHGISKLLNYVKPDSNVDNSFEIARDTEKPFAKPYFVKKFSKCSNKVFNGFTTLLDKDQISNVKDYLSNSRISIMLNTLKRSKILDMMKYIICKSYKINNEIKNFYY